MRRALLGLLLWLLATSSSADTGTSTSTLTIDPAPVSGTTISAANETDRNSDVATWGNAHLHRLSNSTAFGDGAAGNKSLCADAADSTDACVRWDDTANLWMLDNAVAGVFNQIATISDAAGLQANGLLIGDGTSSIRVGLSLAGTRPTTYGDVSVRARNSAAIATNSGTATLMTLDSERWDTDTMHSTSTNTSRLTATTAGKYFISGSIEFASGFATGYRRAEIRLNGATVIASQDTTPPANNSITATRVTVSTHYNLAATDYVELLATQSAGTVNVNASANYSPEFSMVKVP